MGEYGLKIYLMEDETRNISILESINAKILGEDIIDILSALPETDYANLNWFSNCFEPVSNEHGQSSGDANSTSASISTTTTRAYTMWDSDLYWFGSVYAKVGIKLIATNNVPTIGTSSGLCTSKLNYEYIIDASDAAYNNPLRAAGYFRVTNIEIQGSCGPGYYFNQAMWNGAGRKTLAANLSLDASISLSVSVFSAGLSLSPDTVSMPKGNTVSLCDKNCKEPDVMPRKAEIEYTRLVLGNLNDCADFADYICYSHGVSSANRFKCYQAKWSFDITKKNARIGYNSYKSDQILYCTTYFT